MKTTSDTELSNQEESTTPKKTRKRTSTAVTSKRSTSKKAAAEKKESSAAAKPSAAPSNVLSSRDLAMQIVVAAQDKKAEDIVVLQLTGVTSYTDYLVICSGSSDRQVVAIADGIELTMKKKGVRTFSSEGHAEGQWVVLDYGDVVVHVFYHHLRDFYDLEGLWAEAARLPIPEVTSVVTPRP